MFPLSYRRRDPRRAGITSVNGSRLGTPDSVSYGRYVFLAVPSGKHPFSGIGKKTPPFVQLFGPENGNGKWRIKQACFSQEK